MNKYSSVWLAFVQFEAEENEDFNNLIDVDAPGLAYIGAWANVLIDSVNIKDTFAIIEQGLKELKFKLIFIQKIENTALLIEKAELKASVIYEINYIINEGYKFMISDKIFPYVR